MATTIFDKKGFISFLEREIPDDHMIVFTNDTYGTSYNSSPRVEYVRIPFAFHKDTFRNFHLMKFLDSPIGAFGILPKDKVNYD